MEELSAFLRQQTILQIAPKGDAPWIANVLMVCERPETLYFVGSEHTLYGQRLKAFATTAFATAWHAAENFADRKGVQGVGNARVVTAPEEIEHAVILHNEWYPQFIDQITPAWVQNNTDGVHVWAIDADFIKFWNDALYGPEGSTTFTFTE